VQILEIIEKSTEMQWHLKFTEISLGYRIVLKKNERNVLKQMHWFNSTTKNWREVQIKINFNFCSQFTGTTVSDWKLGRLSSFN